MFLIPLVCVLFTARAYSSNGDMKGDSVVDAFLSQFNQSSVIIRASQEPYADFDVATEATCGTYWGSCNPVYFSERQTVLKIDKVTYGAKYNVDRALTVTDDDVKQGLTPSISTSQSTAVTDSTTKGWKVTGKVSGVKGIGEYSNVAAEIGFEYGEQYTKSTTVTTQLTLTAPCPSNNRCTIETVTFFATFSGQCQVKPIINCGGRMDACNYDGRIGGWRDRGPEGWSCPQFKNFAVSRCNGKSYREVPCVVTTPILGLDGTTLTEHIIRRRSLKTRSNRRGEQELDDDDDEGVIEFLRVAES